MSDPYYDDDPRPFFSERSEPVGEPLSWSVRGSHERRGTPEQRWQWRIEAGECPRCRVELVADSEGACDRCGWSLLEEKLRARIEPTPEHTDDYVPTLPGIGLDDRRRHVAADPYGPADVDEDAA